jgi:hypothetical protein
MHRAKIAQLRVRMEGWRQRRPGSNVRIHGKKKEKTSLTHTGLLMEGVSQIAGIGRCGDWAFSLEKWFSGLLP